MTLDSAIGIISRWSSTSDNRSYVFSGDRHEIDQYLQAVDEIQTSIASETAHDQKLAKSELQIAMLRLSDEMRNILRVNGQLARNVDSNAYSSTMTDSASNSYEDDYVYSNVLSEKYINDLRSIAVRMNSAGNLLECHEAYISERKCSINFSYQKLKIQKLSLKDAQKMKWSELELIIKVWVKSTKICFRKIFTYEKQLCENIFNGLQQNDDACFVKSVNDHAIELLNIAKTLSRMPKEFRRFFGILEIYTTLYGLLPEINKLFDAQSSKSIRSMATQVLDELADAVRGALENLEKKVLPTADLSTNVHVDKLSKYVMDFVLQLCQNKQTLTTVSLSKPPLASTVGMNFNIVEFQLTSELQTHVIWIIMCLMSRLEGAKVSDLNFFLMNKFHYIVRKINENPQVKETIGDKCFEKISGKFIQAKDAYVRLTFAKVLNILGAGDKKPLLDRLQRFNKEFEELHKKLAKISLHFQLLQDLRAYMEMKLVPAYTSFLEQLSKSSNRIPAKDLKFTAQKFKSALLDLFAHT